jgi:hypothetical protein
MMIFVTSSRSIPSKPSQRSESYDYVRGTRHGSRVNNMTHTVTVHAFHQGINQDKTFHWNFKEEKYPKTWNQSFVAPAQTDHTLLVFNEYYVPKNDGEKSCFVENTVVVHCSQRIPEYRTSEVISSS